jgi:hypothetical protein
MSIERPLESILVLTPVGDELGDFKEVFADLDSRHNSRGNAYRSSSLTVCMYYDWVDLL